MRLPVLIAAVGALLALPVMAQERAAPDYFLQTLTDLNLAQALATQCEDLSIDPAAAQIKTDAVLEQLAADGFDAEDPVSQMADSSVQLGQLQDAFVERHGLAGADRAAYCAAGLADTQAQIGPGQFMLMIAAQN